MEDQLLESSGLVGLCEHPEFWLLCCHEHLAPVFTDSEPLNAEPVGAYLLYGGPCESTED